jgi:primosomal protein N' (replication factor Y)
MVAKGHHFGNLALVGVVDADLGLGGGDLRAGERTYQLLQQLAGRAGRERVPGRVMLQSFAPDHPVMRALVAGDRDAFMALELAQREAGRLPPFYRLAAIIVEGTHEEQVAMFARALARAAPHNGQVQVLGPAPAPLYRLRGKFRQRMLVRAPREVNVQAWLTDWLATQKVPSALRVKVDIDPYSFL